MLADDHAVIRQGLADYLNISGYEVEAQAGSFVQLKTLLNQKEVDVLICDCRMEGEGPVNLMLHVKRKYPQLAVIFLTGLEAPLLFNQLKLCGAKAVLSKQGELDEILIALQAVLQGQFYASKLFPASFFDQEKLLSNMEFQVLELIIQSKSNKEIAEMLNKSSATINTHRVNVMRKLGVHSVVELVNYCRVQGLLEG